MQIYPDIKAAVESHEIGNGLDHWNTCGKMEGRLPNSLSLDESWYLKAYPDINEQIELGQIANVTQHWAGQGYYEGRLPYSPEIVDFSLNLT